MLGADLAADRMQWRKAKETFTGMISTQLLAKCIDLCQVTLISRGNTSIKAGCTVSNPFRFPSVVDPSSAVYLDLK